MIIFRNLLENNFGLSESWIDIIFDVFGLSEQNFVFNNTIKKSDESVTKNIDNIPFVDMYLNDSKIKYIGEIKFGVPNGYGKAV